MRWEEIFIAMSTVICAETFSSQVIEMVMLYCVDSILDVHMY